MLGIQACASRPGFLSVLKTNTFLLLKVLRPEQNPPIEAATKVYLPWLVHVSANTKVWLERNIAQASYGEDCTHSTCLQKGRISVPRIGGNHLVVWKPEDNFTPAKHHTDKWSKWVEPRAHMESSSGRYCAGRLCSGALCRYHWGFLMTSNGFIQMWPCQKP